MKVYGKKEKFGEDASFTYLGISRNTMFEINISIPVNAPVTFYLAYVTVVRLCVL